MSEAASEEVPRPSELDAVFHLSEVRTDGERLLYYGVSDVNKDVLVERVWPAFRERGYEIQVVQTDRGLDVLVARPYSTGIDGMPWTNVLLFCATLLSTLLVGATAWYYIPFSDIVADPLVALQAWPFTAAVLGVLLTHEFGHYVLGRYHEVDVSLPYVIPFVLPFGTMGAIIRMRGQMPDRKALFDIGVAGPLAGLAATVVVTIIGLLLGPFPVPSGVVQEGGRVIVFSNPPLLDLIADAMGQQAGYDDPTKTAHPVIMGAWVGMFFTVLNLLPVGQLDGGHIVRAMIGKRQETIAALVPIALFGVAAYLRYVRELGINESVGLWAFWGFFSAFIAYRGPANPVDDSSLDRTRMAIGLLTFGLGLLCFMLVPIRVVTL